MKPMLELQEKLQFAERDLPVGSRWTHRNGHTYIIVAHCVIEATMHRGVLYRSEGEGPLWVRPFSEFIDGRFRRAENGVPSI